MIPLPPKGPLARIIKEGKIGDCPLCLSSQVRRYLTGTLFEFGQKIGCIQPKCDNYFDSVQNKRDIKINKILK